MTAQALCYPVRLRWALATLAILLALALGFPAQAQTGGPPVTRLQPIERHPGFPNRVAIVLAPSSAQSVRGAPAPVEAELLARRLRQYGFEVFAIGQSARTELVSAIREITRQLRLSPNAEVALIVYGEMIKAADDLFVAPNDLTNSARQQIETLDVHAVRLSAILRWLNEAQPRRLVTVVDACTGPIAGGSCLAGIESRFSGHGVIATHRRVSAGAAAGGSLHAPLMTVTTTPGLPFSDLPVTLRAAPGTSMIDVVNTPGLTGDFAFLPRDYLETLPHPCNRAGDVLLRPEGPAADLRPQIEACEQAVGIWSYSPHFQSNLAKLRELQDYRLAVASCAAGPIEAYLRSYPGGMYGTQVRAHQDRCSSARRRPPDERLPRPNPEPRPRPGDQLVPSPRPQQQDCKTPATARGDPRCSINRICRTNLGRRGVNPGSVHYVNQMDECQTRLRSECPWCPQ